MSAPRPEVGHTIAHYRLDRVIGIGAMGQVFGATDLRLGRTVAVKVMLGSHESSEEFVRRFRREADTLARLDSPHIVSVYDHGEHEGRPYIVTQHAGGGDLGRLLGARGAMPIDLAVRVCFQIADALADAHRAGVVHRDVKPANVLVRDERLDRIHVYLCDFGVALTDSGGHTNTGAVAGTWTYLAPERIAGDPGSPASDIYSVGTLLWELLTGAPPYTGSDVEVAMQHHDSPLPRLTESDATAVELNRILALTMAKDPADRYADASALRADLKRLLPDGSSTAGSPAVLDAPPAPRRRRTALVAAAVAAVLLLVGGVTTWAVVSGDDDPSSRSAAGGQEPTTDGPTPALPSTTSDPSTDDPDSPDAPDAPGTAAAGGVLGDVDGDGLGDVAFADNPGLVVALSDGSSFGEIEERDVDGSSILLGDFDGDGTRELLRIEGEPPSMTVTVLFQGARRQISTISTPAPSEEGQRYDSDLLAADVDGDGVDDLVVATPAGDGLTVAVAGNRGDGTFARAETWLETELEWRRTIWAVADFDGDGTDELVHTRAREFDPDFETGEATVLTSNGKALQVSAVTLDLPREVGDGLAGLKSVSAGDVDGDQVPELVAHYPYGYGAVVWRWTGDGFGPPEPWVADVDPRNGGENLASVLSDVNGDGLADVVSAAVFTVHVHLSTGSAFVYAPEWDLRAEISDTLVSEVGLGIS